MSGLPVVDDLEFAQQAAEADLASMATMRAAAASARPRVVETTTDEDDSDVETLREERAGARNLTGTAAALLAPVSVTFSVHDGGVAVGIVVRPPVCAPPFTAAARG